ncbi:polysaccharide pyruvyl transferase family protein [Ruegeria halocynthiae]|uniref:polysaccharide pyruvyl transferase family protein n=1 Tax=Ruegeria halocynthiae TaxID=985054 RepID=UPI0005607BC4|nr:polysaccharide pyruvyl transferase family protein [Ruegeria halocynthiae]
MRIFLWGAYQQGNFGDDLMAVLFAKKLEAMGHSVEVYGISTREAQKNGLTVNRDAMDGIRKADAVVMGGGAVLKEAQLLRMIVKSAPRKIEQRYLTLRRAAIRYNKPVYFTSIGSDSIRGFRDISLARRYLFKSDCVKGGTVRLNRDVPLLNERSITAAFYPDVLMGTAKHIDQDPADWQYDTPRILLNFHKRHTHVGHAIVDHIRKTVPNAEILVTRSHLAESGFTYEWDGKDRDLTLMPYEDCMDFCQKLRTMSLVLSSKLHVGLTAMSYGVPFISVGGRGKVRAQLEQLNLQDLCYVDPKSADIPVILSRVSDIKTRLDQMLPEIAEGSKGHFQWLERTLGQ